MEENIANTKSASTSFEFVIQFSLYLHIGIWVNVTVVAEISSSASPPSNSCSLSSLHPWCQCLTFPATLKKIADSRSWCQIAIAEAHLDGSSLDPTHTVTSPPLKRITSRRKGQKSIRSPQGGRIICNSANALK